MVAATEHTPSTAVPEKAVYYTICFDPLAIFLGNTDLAVLVQRLHYWLQNDYCGYLLRDGFFCDEVHTVYTVHRYGLARNIGLNNIHPQKLREQPRCVIGKTVLNCP
jgi:hypothetical protein